MNGLRLVYHFYSLKYNHRLRVKIPVSEEDCSCRIYYTILENGELV